MGNVKNKWVHHELAINQKIVVLKCRLLLSYSTTINHFLIRSWCVMKSGFYKQSVMTSSVVGLRSSSKAPKAKLVPRTGHDHCLVVCCQTDPLQLSESRQNHYIWEVCSANWWDVLKTAMPAADTDQQTGPNSFPRQRPTSPRITNDSIIEWIGLWSFASSAIFTWPLTNQLPLLQASGQLLQGKCSHNQQDAENAFQEFIKFWSMDFYTTNLFVNTLISCWQKCVDCNVSYFD